MKQLFDQSPNDPLLSRFLQEAAVVLRRELSTLEPKMREATGGPFANLMELAERFRNKEDSVGLTHAILVCIVRSAKLLQFAEVDPGLLNGERGQTYLVGICGGLLPASAMLIANDISSLYRSSLEMIRVTCRLSNLMINRSWAVEDTLDSWGWSIIGVGATDLQRHLDCFHTIHNVSFYRRIKIGVSDVDDGWQTVIGPPSVLKQFFGSCTEVKTMPRQKLRISSLTHALESLDEEEVNYILGDSTLLNANVLPQYVLLSLGNTAEYKCTLWRDLLSQVVRDIGTKPLMLQKGLQALHGRLDINHHVALKVMAPTFHLSVVSGFLEQHGRTVKVVHEPSSWVQERDQIDYTGKVAIVGMSGRYPGSDGLKEFWKTIVDGKMMHSEVPPDRFDLDELHDKNIAEHLSTATKYGCFIKQPGLFDARFFNVSPREAVQMDPGHRLFLMAAYEAVEMAGYSRGRFAAPEDGRIATFFGQSGDDWRDVVHSSGGDAFSLGGVQRSFGPGRVNFSMQWSGPAYSIDTACSSSLSSVTLACSSLLARECDMAVTGGANVMASPLTYHLLSKAGFLSTTGGCKTYLAEADGYCRGEFVGAFVLKRLEDAVADKDIILSVIAASARNHSGLSSSMMHSDHRAQEKVMAEVLRKARVDASEVSYVEMHGTGTQVGDYAEMKAVANTFGDPRRASTLKVGAVKAGIGHAEAGAGSAALLKTILMMQTGIIPPQPGFTGSLNPKLPDLERLSIEIPTEPQRLESREGRRSAIINSFDASGGNTCILIQEPPRHDISAPRRPDPRLCHVVTTSAKTAGAHVTNKRRLLDFLQANPSVAIADVAYTTTARRLHYPLRRAYPVKSTAELIDQLHSEVSSSSSQPPDVGTKVAPVVFTFTGQGSAYSGMGIHLYQSSPKFRDKVNLCARLAASSGLPEFLHIITDGDCNEAEQTTAQTQLAIVTLEVALASLWVSCGIKPSIVVGHSLGEYAALHVAGVLSLADMLYLVGRRALLIQERCEARTYSMLAVSADGDSVGRVLVSAPRGSTSNSIACLNSPSSTVVSGRVDDIRDLQRHVSTQNLRSTILPLAYGFHSAQLDPVLEEYISIAQQVPYHAPSIPVASTLLGQIVTTSGVFGPTYQARQAREPVNFVGATRAICSQLQQQNHIWIEIGPASVCLDLARAIVPRELPVTLLPSLDRNLNAWHTVTTALAAVYEAGVEIDWAEFHEAYDSHVHLLTLPSYAFDTKNYWKVYKTPAASSSRTSTAPDNPCTTTLQQLVSETHFPEVKTIFQSSLSESGIADLVKGRRIQGVATAPDALFVDMALTGARYLTGRSNGNRILAARFNSVRNCTFLRPLVLDQISTDQVIQLSVSEPSDSNLTTHDVVSTLSTRSSKGDNIDYARCVVVQTDMKAVTAQWIREGLNIRTRCSEVRQAAKDGAGHRLSTPLFYALFSRTVEYANNYRNIHKVSISENFEEAFAEIRLQASPKGSRFTLSPYWMDTIVHLASFLIDCDPNKPSDTLAVLQSFRECNILEPMVTGKVYQAYTRIQNSPESNVLADVWVFDGKHLVVQYCDLRFDRVSNAISMCLTRGQREKQGAPAPKQKQANPALITEHNPITKQLLTTEMLSNTPSSEASAGSFTSPKSQTSPSTCSISGPKPSISYNYQDEPGKKRILETLIEALVDNTGYQASDLHSRACLSDFGVDSIMATQIVMQVQERLGIEVEARLLYEYTSLEDLVEAFLSQLHCKTSERQKLEGVCDQPQVPTSSGVSNSSISRPTSIEKSVNGDKIDLSVVILEALSAETGTDVGGLNDSTILTDVGVDSIMAIQVAMAIHNATGVEVGAATFRECLTIRDLQRAVSDLGAVSRLSSAAKASPRDSQTEQSLSSNSSWEDIGEAFSRTAVPSENAFLDVHTVKEKEPKITSIPVIRPTIRPESSVRPAGKTVQSLNTPTLDGLEKTHVNIVLMHGCISSKLTPLFMFPDATGSAATYIHLKRLTDNRPVYAIDATLIHSPEQLIRGIEHIASVMADALRTQQNSPYILAGYSAGAILAYETARQLLLTGHGVQGLLLYDMAVPRALTENRKINISNTIVQLLMRLMGRSRNMWPNRAAAVRAQMYIHHMLRCVSNYNPKPMPSGCRPARAVVTWCTRGVAECIDEAFKHELATQGVSCHAEAVDYMQSSDSLPLGWIFPPNKPLGANGWGDLVGGSVRCMAIEADHFSMVLPPDVSKFQDALEEGLAYCTEQGD
ncbi:ketoacyl-synt-domain-containing protein [Corynespora cassiicola Philippines]|uniref:Ketoacyl-synt-domain-containing protein n=1 Tax=Corynespora cassiicola Philippines TaxID=1448308 RepID=A0A2T2NFP1_CORCC|nr:ketoacyl-synt-domain-containing protein [Corynespora cassiicola Philippines]